MEMRGDFCPGKEEASKQGPSKYYEEKANRICHLVPKGYVPSSWLQDNRFLHSKCYAITYYGKKLAL